MRRLHGDVGDARHYGRASRTRHLQFVRVSAADDVALIEDGDGAVQIEMGPQDLRVNVQAVAVSPRLNPNPLEKLVGVYGPHFKHLSDSP